MDKERVKYGFIGEIIVKLLSKREDKPNILTNYLHNTPKKTIFKDIWFILSVLGWFYFMFWVMGHYQELILPSVKDPISGVTVTGNCTFIREMYNDLQNAKKGHSYIIPENYTYELPQKPFHLDIQEPTYNCTQLCPTPYTTTTLMCPPPKDCVCDCPICTKCPTCTYEFTPKQIDWWLNDCVIKDGGTGYQGGSADTCFKAMEYFNIPGRPKFRLGGTAFYRNQIPEEDCKVCFMDEDCDGKIKLNNSIWGIWGDGVIKTIYKMG